MHYLSVLIVIILVLFSSCQDVTTPSNAKLSSGEIKLLDIDNENNKLYSFSGNLFPARVHTHTSDGKYLRQNGNGSISIFDLEHNTAFEIKPPMEGPSGLDYLSGFCYYSKDSILVFGTNELHLYDSKGTFHHKRKFSDALGDVQLPSGYLLSLNPNYQVPKIGGRIFLKLMKKDAGDMFSFPYAYEGPLYGMLSLGSDTVVLTSILHENLNDFYGGIHKSNTSVIGRQLFVTHEYSPNIHVYDANGQHERTVEAPPLLGLDNMPYVGSADPFEVVDHLNKNVTYGNLYGDPEHNFRFQVALIPSPDNYGKSRRGAVRVFDSQFNLIGDFTLPKYTKANNAYVSGDTLFVEHGRSSLDEDQVYYRALVVE